MAHIFRRSRPKAGRLLLYLVLFVGAAAGLNAWIFAGGGADWSASLAEPAWSPPGRVVGAVWMGLFALMAVAAFLIDRSDEPQKRFDARAGVIAWWALCMSWTGLYFGLQSVANGFYVTAVAFALGLPVLWLAWRASAGAALALLPLQAWLGFALALSYRVWRLNA
ncbi:MAG: TspO/MBR family protein [Oceanicaulis sp.]